MAVDGAPATEQDEIARLAALVSDFTEATRRLEREYAALRARIEGLGEDRHPPAALVVGGLAGLTVRDMERRLIAETLARTNQNRTQAAKLLGISIRTLRNKLAEYRRAATTSREPGN